MREKIITSLVEDICALSKKNEDFINEIINDGDKQSISFDFFIFETIKERQDCINNLRTKNIKKYLEIIYLCLQLNIHSFDELFSKSFNELMNIKDTRINWWFKIGSDEYLLLWKNTYSKGEQIYCNSEVYNFFQYTISNKGFFKSFQNRFSSKNSFVLKYNNFQIPAKILIGNGLYLELDREYLKVLDIKEDHTFLAITRNVVEKGFFQTKKEEFKLKIFGEVDNSIEEKIENTFRLKAFEEYDNNVEEKEENTDSLVPPKEVDNYIEEKAENKDSLKAFVEYDNNAEEKAENTGSLKSLEEADNNAEEKIEITECLQSLNGERHSDENIQVNNRDFIYSIDDFKVTRVPWNIYDTVLLAELVVKVEKEEVNKSEGIEILSHTLRDCGRTVNKIIDEKFRNINGITMQFSCMKGVFPGPNEGKGLRNGSKLMKEAVHLYLNDKDKFEQTIKESLRMIENNKSHELEYYYWLKEKGFDTIEAFDCFNRLNDYCLKNKLVTSDLLLTLDVVILENIKRKLSEDTSFKNEDKNSYNILLNALKSYYSFVSSINVSTSEKIEYITSLSDKESLSSSEIITSSLKDDENIFVSSTKNGSGFLNEDIENNWKVGNNDTVCWVWHKDDIEKRSFTVSSDVANCLKRINNKKSVFWFFYEKNIYHMFLKQNYNDFNNNTYKLSFEQRSFKFMVSQFKEGDLLYFKASNNNAVCIRMTRQESKIIQEEIDYESKNSLIVKSKNDSPQYDQEDKIALFKEDWHITDNTASVAWNDDYLEKNTINIRLDEEAKKFFYANNLTIAKLYNITIHFNNKYFDSFLEYDGTHTYVIINSNLLKEIQNIGLNCIKELKFINQGMSIDTFNLKIEKNECETVSSIVDENYHESISTSEGNLRSSNFGNVFFEGDNDNDSLSNKINENSLNYANAYINSSNIDQTSHSEVISSIATSEGLTDPSVNSSSVNTNQIKAIHNDEKISSNNDDDPFNHNLDQKDQDSLDVSHFVSNELGIWTVKSKDSVILNWKKEYLKMGIPITTNVADFFNIRDDLFSERKFDFILLTLGTKKYSCMIRLKLYKNGIEKLYLFLSGNIYKHLKIYENSLIKGTDGIELEKKASAKHSYSITVVNLDTSISFAQKSVPAKANDKTVKKSKKMSYYHFLGANKNYDEIYEKVNLVGYLENDILLELNKKNIFNWKELLDSDLSLDGSYNGQITSIVTGFSKLKQDIIYNRIKFPDAIPNDGNKQGQLSSLNVKKVNWVIYDDNYAELYCPIEMFKSQGIPISSKSAERFFDIDSYSEGKRYIFKIVNGSYSFKIIRIKENIYAFKIPVHIYDMLKSIQSGIVRVNITKSKSGYAYDYKFEIYNPSSKVRNDSHTSNAFGSDSDFNDNAADNNVMRISKIKSGKENLPKVNAHYSDVTNRELTEDELKYQKILSLYFKNGYRIGDKIAVRQFKIRWRKEFSEELTLANENIENNILKVTIHIEGNNGREFCYVPSSMLSEEKANRIHKYILDIFNEGKDIIYYSSLYEYFKDDLNYTNVSSVNILKELLKYLYSDEFFFGEESIKSKDSTKIDANSMILNYLTSQDQNILVSDLDKEFSNIPEEKINDILRLHDSIIFNRNGKNSEVFHADILELNKEEYLKIRTFMKNEIQSYRYLTDVQLYKWAKENMDEFFDKYNWLTQIGFRDAIAYKFKEEFFLNSKIFCKIDDIYNVDRVYEEFGLYHSSFTVNDLRNLNEEIGGNINLKKVFNNSVRINQDEFVSKKSIHFNISQTDQTIENFMTNEYIPITAIQQFAFFPNCGYPWNHYLLQSYLISYSRKFDFLCRNLGITNYAGAILAKNSRFNDYDDVLIDVLANANIQLTTNNANQYLMDNHYIFNKITKLNIEMLVRKAKAIKKKN